jgi:uncharacterized OB-fold protein
MSAASFEVASSPPLPLPDGLTRFFWEGVEKERLMILRCRDCGHFVHYPRPICNRCQSTTLSPEQVSGRGTLYSYSVVLQAFHPYFVDKIPYVLAVVELAEEPGLRLTTNMVDTPESELAVGMPVEVTFVKVTDRLVLPMFRPSTGKDPLQ